MDKRALGDLTLGRIVESDRPEFPLEELVPQATAAAIAPHRHWLEATGAIDPASGYAILPVQSYIIRTRHHTILIDSCIGDHKTNEWHKPWHMRTGGSYLADLAAAGVAPEAVDFVMCTHMHSDHIGWNTRLVDGRWAPSFANAKYVFARTEIDHWRAEHEAWARASYVESVLPVIAAGQAVMVETDYAIDDQVWLEPLPGHTPGHVGIHLASNGAEAVMCGDAMHSPVQCAHPEWSSSACVDPVATAATRRAFLERYCETNVLVLTAHFPSPSIGFIVPEADAFRFAYQAWDD